MKIIQLPIMTPPMVICSHTKGVETQTILIDKITEKELIEIRKGEPIFRTIGKTFYVIKEDDIYCFGKIDFTDGSEDMQNLDTFNWLDYLGIQGICIPTRYNYQNHSCKTPLNVIQFTETFKPSKLTQYIHGCIGKPEKVVIFKLSK